MKTKNCPVWQFFVSMMDAISKRAEILEESIDQNDPNHQQAQPDNRPIDEYGYESDPTGQTIGSPLEAQELEFKVSRKRTPPPM